MVSPTFPLETGTCTFYIIYIISLSRMFLIFCMTIDIAAEAPVPVNSHSLSKFSVKVALDQVAKITPC